MIYIGYSSKAKMQKCYNTDAFKIKKSLLLAERKREDIFRNSCKNFNKNTNMLTPFELTKG